MIRPRTLVIDARPAVPQIDGLGTYVREVVPRLVAGVVNARIRVLVLPTMADYWHETLRDCAIEMVNSRPLWPRQQIDVPLYLRGSEMDVYFYPAHDPPVLLNTRLVFSVMDVNQLQIPHFHERYNWLKTAYGRLVFNIAVRRASHVFAISEWTRTSIGRVVGAKYLSRISVTPLSTNRVAMRTGARTHLLYVGTDRPHKNLDRLLRAYAIAAERSSDLAPLVLAGQLRQPANISGLIRDLGIADRVVTLGYVPNEHIDRLYGNALALVLVSLGEGFGLTILEAMANGVPVVTSRMSAMSEVAGDAAVTVDPYDVRSIADGILAIAQDANLRATLVQRGLRRAADFSWDDCAAQTRTVLQRLLDDSRSPR